MGKLLKGNWGVWLFLIASRVALISALLIASNQFTHYKSFADFTNTFAGRWDGNSHRFLAEHWYQPKGNEGDAFIVFLPLYPFLLRTLNIFSAPTAAFGFYFSTTIFIIASYILYKLLSLDYQENFAKSVIALLTLFPTSTFFSINLPESLFLLLTVTCLFFARKKKFAVAFILAGLASITRTPGAFLYLAVGWEWFCHSKRRVTDLIYMALSFVYPLSYLWINYWVNGDPFSFFYFHKAVWQKSFAPPWHGIIGSWNLFVGMNNWTIYQRLTIGLAEFTASISAWAFGTWAIVTKLKIRTSYMIFYLASILLFTSTSFILSSPRYLLSAFPFFIILRFLLKNKVLYWGWIIFSVTLLVYYGYQLSFGNWAF